VIAVFHNIFDWTAVGTLALAIVTGISLAFGWGSLRQNQEEIALSRREVEEAHRPVVVPVADRRRMDPAGPGVTPGDAFPRVYEAGRLLVPIENIGSGPALRIEATVRLLDEAGDPSLAPSGPVTPAYVAGLGQSMVLPLDIAAHGWQIGVCFELTLLYEDVAGKRWRTVGSYIDGRMRYEKVSISKV
jgi:hypothetical protein